MAKRKARKKYRVVSLDADWYSNPAMNGHHWAVQSHRLATQELKPFAKKKAQKELLKVAVNFQSTNWHYWCNWVSKKDIRLAKHCLKAIAKGETWTEIYRWVNYRHASIVSPMLRFLEVKSYDEDPQAFLDRATSYYTGLGMAQADANKRIVNRIEGYRVKTNERLEA